MLQDLKFRMFPSLHKGMGMLLAMVLLFPTVNALAFASNAQRLLEQTVSLIGEEMQVSEVLSSLETQTQARFVYSSRLINAEQKVGVHISNKKLSEALDAVLKPINVTYKVQGRQIILSAVPEGKSLIEGPSIGLPLLGIKDITATITGRVTDVKGEGLPGVSVLVKGTTIGASTDVSGAYTLNAPDANGTLVFSYVGYSTQEIEINNRTTINVQLSVNAQALDEVVVTALGIRREKKALTYAVQEVGGENLTKAREINVGNALAGRVAGVTASPTSGGPSASSRVIIRGNGSLAGDNQPLYVVNGMPITNNNLSSPGTYGGIDRGDGLSSINPDDIESISVLKGGTAAALYGARAANGVIIITTKSGRAQQGIGVEYNTTYTLEQPMNLLDWQYQYGSGLNGAAPTNQGQAVAFGRTSWGARLDPNLSVIQPDGQSRPYAAQRDNIKNFYDVGRTFSNNIALSGGNEIANFRFGASNMDNTAIVPNNTMNRKTFNLAANATLAKKIVFQGTAQYSTEDVKNRARLADFTLNPNAGTQLIATNLDVRTLSPGYQENGNEMLWSDYIYSTNPYFAINKVKNGDTRNRFMGSFSTQYNLTESVYARARFGIDQSNVNGYYIEPTGTAFNAPGSMTRDQSVATETNVEAIVGFNRDFGPFTLNTFVGGNQMKNSFDGINLNSGQFNLPFQYFIGNGTSQVFGQDFRELAINSVFASADISFNNYLYLNLTGRNDWFSTLDPSNNSLFYPSVGLSFVASDAWNSKPLWMDYAKVRTSWAQVGGGAPNPYAIHQTFSAQAVPHLGQQLMAVTSATIPSLLTPYTSTTAEAGIEMRVLNNRVGFDVTVYDRTTTNDIVNAAIPPSSGYNNVALNVGKMKNRGVELMITGTPMRLQNGFAWDMTYNMAYNENQVISIAEGLTALQLPGATTRTLNGWIYHFEGQPFGMIAGFRHLRADNGQLVYNRTSGLPVAGPLEALGRGVPPLAVGFNNNFTFKNFNLSFLLDSRWGGHIYSATNAYGTDFGLHQRTVADNVRETGIQVSGVDQRGDAFSATIPAQNYFRGTAYTITENFVQKADFIKLRAFTLGYNLPASFLAKTPLQAANISIVGRNLLLLYNTADNIDPESNYNNSNAQGLENFGLPTTRSYGLNLTVRF